jgi:RNA polymerase sigma-70 factor (ECF subfamily)
VVALLRRLHPTRAPVSDTAGDADAILAARAQQDPLAFEPLYARYVEDIARFCFARLRDEERARDATQQTFARALIALPAYQEQGQFRGWLYAIARNVIANDVRAMRSHDDLDDAIHLVATGQTPEQAAIASLSRQALLRAIARLPDDQREAIELRMTGLTGVQIAEVMERSHDSVRMLQRRAIERLRLEMATFAETKEGRHGA